MKQVAIIGAGFCGLSLAHFLLQFGRYKVTLFDSHGIGGGASGVATGLLHPYAGEQGRRSWNAEKGIGATLALLDNVEKSTGLVVASYDGIVRIVQNDAQRAVFLKHSAQYGDVNQLDESTFLIRSGVTVHCQNYLQGLWKMVESGGGALIEQRIAAFSDLNGYDHVVLAAGGGISSFLEAKHLRFSRTKGQVLTAEVPEDFQATLRSTIGKGYVAKGEFPNVCYFGSTYERSLSSEEPEFSIAQERIMSNITTFFPKAEQFKLVGCRAGIRVSRLGHYYPMVAQFSPNTWGLTGMGSRGLLYHAYLANFLAQAIDQSDVVCIPQEVFVGVEAIAENIVTESNHAR